MRGQGLGKVGLVGSLVWAGDQVDGGLDRLDVPGQELDQMRDRGVGCHRFGHLLLTWTRWGPCSWTGSAPARWSSRRGAPAEKGPYCREVGRDTVRLRGRREGRPTATVTFSRQSLAGCRGQPCVSNQCSKNYGSRVMAHRIMGFRKKTEYVNIVTFNLMREPVVSSMITIIFHLGGVSGMRVAIPEDLAKVLIDAGCARLVKPKARRVIVMNWIIDGADTDYVTVALDGTPMTIELYADWIRNHVQKKRMTTTIKVVDPPSQDILEISTDDNTADIVDKIKPYLR